MAEMNRTCTIIRRGISLLFENAQFENAFQRCDRFLRPHRAANCDTLPRIFLPSRTLKTYICTDSFAQWLTNCIEALKIEFAILKCH